MGKIKSITKFKSPEVEKLTDEFVKPAVKQLNGFGEGFFNQLLGTSLGKDSNSQNGTVKSNEIFVKDPVTGEVNIFHAADHKNKTNTKSVDAEKIKKPEIKAAIDYSGEFMRSSENAMHKEMREINQRMQDIMAELQRLINSSKVLKTEFADVTIQQAPAQAGEYHINFFEWLLITIRAARQKVEDSGAWLKAVKSKKNKKGYWNMFKKHGTTFGLSNERTVATQTG